MRNHEFGEPLGLATWQGNQMFRTFASGTTVTWFNGTEQFEIRWSDGTRTSRH